MPEDKSPISEPATRLGAPEIAFLAREAGFTGEDIVIATAVALAESSGNTYAHNPTPPDDSYGLWQINMIGSLGAARRQQFGLSANRDLFQPALNAKAAFAIFKSSGWNAWSVYKTRAYTLYLPAARVGAATPRNPRSARPQDEGGVTEVTDVLKPLKDLFEWVMNLLRPLGLRLAGFVGGGVLLIIAIILYVRWQSR